MAAAKTSSSHLDRNAARGSLQATERNRYRRTGHITGIRRASAGSVILSTAELQTTANQQPFEHVLRVCQEANPLYQSGYHGAVQRR